MMQEDVSGCWRSLISKMAIPVLKLRSSSRSVVIASINGSPTFMLMVWPVSIAFVRQAALPDSMNFNLLNCMILLMNKVDAPLGVDYRALIYRPILSRISA